MPKTTIHATAVALHRLLGPLRRAVSRASRSAAGDLPDLPDAQIEVLRLLAESGPISVGQLAEKLGLAASTSSNLLKAMSAGGLVESSRADADQRRVTVCLSARSRELLHRYDAAGSRILEGALRSLAPDERAIVAAAIPILDRVGSTLRGSPLG
jgi:DNA-binding MarR family transcriptional regulator